MIDLWMVRHGETDWNLQGRIQGWTDIPLNARGVEQAKRLAAFLEGIPFTTLLASDLTRARQTARILQETVPVPVSVTKLVRERFYGSEEGMTREQRTRVFPHGAVDAETPQHLARRAQRFLDILKQDGARGRVLCVSHGGFIRALLSVLGAEQTPHLQNTSVSRIRGNGSNWTLEFMNWADHVVKEPVSVNHR